jgi:hypothetical protein
MRAHTIKIMLRRRRNARRRRALGLALGICALAIPASASADPMSGDYSRADAIAAGLEESSQSSSGSDYSSLNATVPPVSEPSSGYTSLNATTGPSPIQPTFASGSPSGNDGFQWGDAALGAGAAMALVAFGAAALLTVRRRTTVSPSASAS